jgi:DNA replication and repair protein RecF
MLTGFRSYEALTVEVEPGPVMLLGENGAGKTNLIEAISLLGPGRGLRGASLAEFPFRRAADAEPVSAWAVAARIETLAGPVDIGTGVTLDAPERRQGRCDGSGITLSALAGTVRIVWLTPAMDRLFVEGPSGRRRFLDRLTLALEPTHAAASAGFERAMRERNRLLRDGPRDPAWLSGLEAEMAHHGVALAAARTRMVTALSAVLAEPGAFPRPLIRLEGYLEDRLSTGDAPAEIAADYCARLAYERPRDEAAGRTLSGPHTSDLQVSHEAGARPAAQCSTGEQKALLIALVLAQAKLVAEEAPDACALLLLDEIGAHLDARRRAALFDAICALKIQAWLTGTEPEPFTAFGARAQGFRLAQGQLAPL